MYSPRLRSRSIAYLFLILWSCISVQALDSVQGFFDVAKDGAKFKKLFLEGLNTDELSSIHYSIQGMKYLNTPVPNTNVLCQKVIKLAKEAVSIEQIYYAASARQALQCKEAINPEASKTAQKILSDLKSNPTDVLHSIQALKALGHTEFNKATISKFLQDFLKKDDSISNLGVVFHICSEIQCGTWAAERIEDAVIQADEVDGKMLHWEGGLPVTGLVLTGIIRLAQADKKPTQISQEQGVKLSNYLLSRRSVQSVKGGCVLLEALNLMADEKSISPVCITLKGRNQISGSEQVFVSVSDLLGRPHPSVTADSVQAQSATRLQDDVIVLSKQTLTKHSTEATTYTLDLMKVKPDRGLYKIALSAGTSSGTVSVRILGIIDIDSVEVGVGDVDGSSTSRLTSVSYPKSLSQPFEADALQKIIVKFALREKGQTQLAKVHQTFVRIFSKTSDIEVIFVAEVESQKIYKMDVDVGSVADKFNYASGLYSIELIIGDAAISNPIKWIVADVNLKFPTASKDATLSQVVRDVKPEIAHMFREPDARPPRVVSDIFTGLCIAPIVLLFIIWMNIGINVKNFPFSLSAFGFHLGLGSILGLFVVFWLKLNMFETIRYLLALGLITFICGNRLLRNIAAKRKRAP